MAELRVLVCDDDFDMLELMVRRLDKMGFKPDRAGDGGVAQTLIRENLYDVIVTDIYMPEATGLELLEMAKQRDPHTQVVIVTASATLDNAIDALNHGAFGYLSKPFDHLSVFDTTVSRALEFRQLIMANRRMAEAQKMRGDMLEDEVAKRVGQLREKQQGLLDLLNCLPDGIVVVEEGGKLMMTSPAAEQWLTRERRSGQQPIAEFIAQVHSEWAESSGYVQLGEDKLRLLSIDYPHPNGKHRKAVIIRKSEDEEPTGPGTLALETIAAVKSGLAWLFRQNLSGPAQQRVRELANHISTLEQVTGTAGLTGEADLPRPVQPLAPAVLPEYLRHEPSLDAPGGHWERAEVAPTMPMVKPSAAARSPEPDTRPAGSTGKDQVRPPIQVQADQPYEDEAEAAATTAAVADEVESAAERRMDVSERLEQLEAELEELPVELQPAEAAAAAAGVARPAAEQPADQPQGPPLEQVSKPEPELASAPTRVIGHSPAGLALAEDAQAENDLQPALAADAQAETQLEPVRQTDLPEESPEVLSPTDTGRIPLWQRISKKRGTLPLRPMASQAEREAPGEVSPKAKRVIEMEAAPEAELQAEGEAVPDAASQPEIEEESAVEQRFAEVAARLNALAGKEPGAESAPRGKRREPAPRKQASPKPTRGEPPAAQQPALAAARPPARRKRIAWPPELPSKDPGFDPELEVSD